MASSYFVQLVVWSFGFLVVGVYHVAQCFLWLCFAVQSFVRLCFVGLVVCWVVCLLFSMKWRFIRPSVLLFPSWLCHSCGCLAFAVLSGFPFLSFAFQTIQVDMKLSQLRNQRCNLLIQFSMKDNLLLMVTYWPITHGRCHIQFEEIFELWFDIKNVLEAEI